MYFKSKTNSLSIPTLKENISQDVKRYPAKFTALSDCGYAMTVSCL